MMQAFQSTVTINDPNQREKIYNDLIKKISLWELEFQKLNRHEDPHRSIKMVNDITQAKKLKNLFAFRHGVICLTAEDADNLQHLMETP